MKNELLIGIDEAGLGPLLGPFCISAFTTNRTWSMAIKDSKKLHKKGSLTPLISACSVYLPGFDIRSFRQRSLDYFGPEDEPWFGEKNTPEIPLRLCIEEISKDTVHSLSVGVSRFNESLSVTENKSETTGQYLTQILQAALGEIQGHDYVSIWVDRQGGRKHYEHLVESWGIAVKDRKESSELSSYFGHLKDMPCAVHFAVKADARRHAVAAASCFSKLRREIAMEKFNKWWKDQVPELKPTAGYWVDGLRFMADVEFCCERLKINPNSLKRNK